MEPSSSLASRSRGRPREFDMDEALDRAIDVFRQRGYTATSLAELAEGMQLSRGSLYKAFADKQSIFIAAYDRYVADGTARQDAAYQGKGKARERLEAMLNDYARRSSGDEGQRGCLVVATAVELSVTDPELAERVEAAWLRTERTLLRLLDEGKRDGSMTGVTHPAATARLMLCLLQGMRLVGKSTELGAPAMRQVAQQALRLVD
jgi:AcrR family transcriptional regulator